MANAWVEFVRRYAKDNNISYACAINDASPEYRKLKELNELKNKPKKRITPSKKKTKEEEKPKEVEPPRARRKYFEGLSEGEKEDRKRYKDYRRIKCAKMDSMAFIIDQYQLKGNFQEAQDKLNTIIETGDVPITPEIYSKPIKSKIGIQNLIKQIIDDIVYSTNDWGECYQFMSDEGLFKELTTLLKNNAPSIYERLKRADEERRLEKEVYRRRDGLQPLYDGKEMKTKKKISLPPLQSNREISLYSFKKDDLSKISKAQNVNGISKMKKDDMIKKILEMEGLEEGVKWGDKELLLRDLKEAKRCNDPKDSINGLQSLQYQLNKQKEKLEKMRSLKSSNIDEARVRQRRIRLAQNNIERITENVNKCNSLLSRDLEKEYKGAGNTRRNVWVEFVKQYAKDNNLSYGCAISEAGPEYRKMKAMNKTPKEKKKKKSLFQRKRQKLIRMLRMIRVHMKILLN